jgi:hypothetical protein
MDNACPHNSRQPQRCIEASKAERLPHPDDNPESAPSGFFFFVYIKGKPYDYDCESRKDLLNVINEIFIGIDQEVLLNVFKSGVNWLAWVIKDEGKYYTKLRKNKRHFFNIGRESGRTRTYGPPILQGVSYVFRFPTFGPSQTTASNISKFLLNLVTI